MSASHTHPNNCNSLRVTAPNNCNISRTGAFLYLTAALGLTPEARMYRRGFDKAIAFTPKHKRSLASLQAVFIPLNNSMERDGSTNYLCYVSKKKFKTSQILLRLV